MELSIADALFSLGGTHEDFTRIAGGVYEGIDWVDEPKFTKEELETELLRLQQVQQANIYQELRAAEYPDFRDYLDGVVKGDQAQIDEYVQKCLAVKAKYPKPEG